MIVHLQQNHVPCSVTVFSGSLNRRQRRYYSAGGEVDLVVIGSGPGGYVAAIKAAQLGMNVGISRYLSYNLYR